MPLILKYFCITPLCLAIPTRKTVLKWIIVAWNIFARVCAMTDCFPSSCSPSPAPSQGLEAGCSTLAALFTRGECKLRYLLRPRPLGSLAPRRFLLPVQPVPWWLWDQRPFLPSGAAQWAFLSLINQEEAVLLGVGWGGSAGHECALLLQNFNLRCS